MTVEVTVTNPAYWSDRALQLAQLLRSAGEGGGPPTVGDPTGTPPDPERVLAILPTGPNSHASWRRCSLWLKEEEPFLTPALLAAQPPPRQAVRSG